MRQAVDLLHDGIAECPTHCVPWPRSRLLEAIAETFSGWPGHSDEASAAMEEATQALLIGAGECEDARDSSALLSRAGELLVQQYGRQADPELMDRAVDCYQQAADAAESSPEWPRHLSRLATTITARYEFTGDPADLERARSLRRRAAEAVDMQRPSPLREQTRLATALAALIRARSSKD